MIRKARRYIEIAEYNEFYEGEIVTPINGDKSLLVPGKPYKVESFIPPLHANTPALVFVEGSGNGEDAENILTMEEYLKFNPPALAVEDVKSL